MRQRACQKDRIHQMVIQTTKTTSEEGIEAEEENAVIQDNVNDIVDHKDLVQLLMDEI